MAEALARHVPPASSLVLALSGGLDSVVLLHLLAALRAQHPFVFAAVHVHHGLSPHADSWADFCTRLCAAHAVPLTIARVQVDCADPAGIEATARRERQRVFAQVEADFLLTAHHQDDQAETFLLQALRGAGPKGLAAMPVCQDRPGMHAAQLRPLLDVPRTVLKAYAQAANLEWVEDDSNADRRYRRNALRLDVMPPLAAHFPGAAATLARAASLQADAADLLDDLARLDAVDALAGARLECAALARLTPPRARNLLRHFIALHGARLPAMRRLDEILKQLCEARTDARVRVELDAAEIRRYRGGAYVVPRCARPEPAVWQGGNALVLPGLGTLQLRETRGEGLRAAALQTGQTRLQVRAGGEHLRLAAGGSTRSLKTLMQERAMPPWARERVAVLRLDAAVLWVAGFGCNADWLAGEGEAGWVPAWQPDRA